MTKLVIALILVGAILMSGLMALLRNANRPMAPPDVMERVKRRARELEEQDERERREEDR